MIIPGGIGTGKDNIGVPVLRGLVKLICAQYDLTVFSLAKINPGFVAEGFELVEAHHSNPVIRILKFSSVFGRHHRKKNFVAVHGFWAMPAGLLAVIAGKRHKIKSIVSLLGGDAVGLPEINYGRLRKPVMRRLIFWTLRNASHPNALTKYLALNLTRHHFSGDVYIIPWGVDRELFDYHPKPLSEPVRFLHVANLHPVKDQTTLLRAFDLIRREVPSKLEIVGTGEDYKKLVELIGELDLNGHVQIGQPMPYESLSSIYHRSDILLHTSLSEGQSEVVTEAMSCGLLVCGTRVGLMFDLPDCCIAVDVGDYEALATKTVEVIRDPQRMNAIRMKANEWTSKHDIHWTFRQYLNVYGS
jgi:glycosyltransferase involved in cell wall biosynthesis